MIAQSATEPAAAQEDLRQFRAFVRDEETRRTVDQVVAELMIPNAAVQRGGVEDAVRLLGTQRSPRLLIVDLSGIELPLTAMSELAEVCEPGVTVIGVGERNDVGLFRDLINSGVSDYLVKPVTAALLRKSLVNVIESTSQPRQNSRVGRMIAVIGSRGGVGATTAATNIAWTIAHRRRRRVALLDLDLQYGTVALALDLEPCHGLGDALEQPGRIDGLFLDRLMVQQTDTLYVLSGEEPLGELVVPDPTALDVLIQELRNKFHYVVVDVPRQVSPATQHVLSHAGNLVIVTDLSLAGMRDTLRQLSMLPMLNAACQLTVCANRCGEHREGEIGRKEFEAGIGRGIDLLIPFDGRSVAAAGNAGQPIAAGRGKVATAIHELTERVAGGASRPPASRAWLASLLRRA
jgi:pilus assembly protein CpaE